MGKIPCTSGTKGLHRDHVLAYGSPGTTLFGSKVWKVKAKCGKNATLPRGDKDSGPPRSWRG